MQGNHPPRIDLVVGIHEIKCHHHQRSQRRFMAYVPKHIKAHSPHNKLAEPPTKENKLLSRGEVFGMTPEWSFIPTITICLILATNLIVFIMWQSASTPESKMFMVNNFTTSLANTMERPWTVVTHIFSHATLSHFLWNMFNLYATAFIVQRALGWTGFMVVYFGGGIIPSLLIDGVRYLELRDVLQQLEQHSKVKTPSMRRSLLEQEKELQLKAATLLHGRSLGASGSICALLGSLLVMFPHSRIPLLTMIPYIQDHVFLFCSFMVIMDLFLINANDNVGHVAHLSGFGLGLLITAAYFARRRRLPPTRAYF